MKPSLEAHEQWLIDLENRVIYLENSQHFHQNSGEILTMEEIITRLKALEDKPPITHLTMNANSLKLDQRLEELDDTLQEHLKEHWSKKKDIKKKNVLL